jgi:hypothetical protein
MQGCADHQDSGERRSFAWKGIYMLTTDQLQEARAKLDQAKALVTEVRDLYFAGHDISGARLLGEVVAALADEILTLGKAIGTP